MTTNSEAQKLTFHELVEENFRDHNKLSTRQDVTVGISVTFKNNEGTDVEAHMTITYLGNVASDIYEPHEQALIEFQSIARTLKSSTGHKLTVIRHDKFGPKSDIPVLLVKPDEQAEKLFINFHQKYGQCEPNMSSKLIVPIFHVSLKFNDLAFARDLSVGTEIEFHSMFMKRLGNCPPFFIESINL